jgi:two-component system OmpR family sensor kinase
MSRPLTLFAIIFVILGLALALVVRLALPTTVLTFGAEYDPASVLVITTVGLGLALLGGAGFLRWQEQKLKRALTEQAAVLETERRRFIQRLDHELKNPLTAIQVQLDNLQADTQANQAVRDVRAQADRLSTLTRGLRRLADLESRPLELERVEIDELLDEVAELLQTPVRLTLDVQRVPWPIPPLMADRELLLMALRNLADNALKYSGDKAVQVRARDTSGALHIEIVDLGRGILEADLPHVAEELYRGSNSHDVAGSGLGLAMVQRIVARHGGKLDLRSRPGQGTIATLQLPYEQKA